jgi:short-subunit dehydrogenase
MGQFRTAVVIGASVGIGAEMVRQLAASGTMVAAVSRRLPELEALQAACGGAERVRVYGHDVKAFDEAPGLFDRIAADLGSVDCLVYNAGVMPRVEESEYNFAKDREMIEVNLLGAMAWLNPAAAYMEARGAGTLVGVSSVAGDRGRRGNPAYHTSKAALTAYLEALRNRLDRYGVHVVTVKPGPVATAMTEGLKLPLMITAEEAARGALALAEGGTGVGYGPRTWAPIMLTIQHVPSVIFRRTNI